MKVLFVSSGAEASQAARISRESDPTHGLLWPERTIDSIMLENFARTDFWKFDVVHALDARSESELKRVASPLDLPKIRAKAETQTLAEYCDSVRGEFREGILLEPLTWQTLDEAMELLNSTFPDANRLHQPGLALKLSLSPGTLRSRLAFSMTRVESARYWVALEKATRRVIAVQGIYDSRRDASEASWGGWGCVAPAYRRRRLGQALFVFVTDTIRRSGKRFARSYASTHFEPAQNLFERMGARTVKARPGWFKPARPLYREIQFE